jgi:hypothetical protein
LPPRLLAEEDELLLDAGKVLVDLEKKGTVNVPSGFLSYQVALDQGCQMVYL